MTSHELGCNLVLILHRPTFLSGIEIKCESTAICCNHLVIIWEKNVSHTNSTKIGNFKVHYSILYKLQLTFHIISGHAVGSEEKRTMDNQLKE